MAGIETSAATVLRDCVIPLFVDFFYEDDEDLGLQVDLQERVTDGAKNPSMTLKEIFCFFERPETDNKFDAIATLASYIQVDPGFTVFQRHSRELAKTIAENSLLEDPIINARCTGKIATDLYREYASFAIRNISGSVMIDMFEQFFLSMPLNEHGYIERSLEELALRFAYKVRIINLDSVEDRIRDNMIRFDIPST